MEGKVRFIGYQAWTPCCSNLALSGILARWEAVLWGMGCNEVMEERSGLHGTNWTAANGTLRGGVLVLEADRASTRLEKMSVALPLAIRNLTRARWRNIVSNLVMIYISVI